MKQSICCLSNIRVRKTTVYLVCSSITPQESHLLARPLLESRLHTPVKSYPTCFDQEPKVAALQEETAELPYQMKPQTSLSDETADFLHKMMKPQTSLSDETADSLYKMKLEATSSRCNRRLPPQDETADFRTSRTSRLPLWCKRLPLRDESRDLFLC